MVFKILKKLLYDPGTHYFDRLPKDRKTQKKIPRKDLRENKRLFFS